jgi:hypothetical protein
MAKAKSEQEAIKEEDGDNVEKDIEVKDSGKKKKDGPVKVKSIHKGVSISMWNEIVHFDEQGEAEVSPETAEKLKSIPGYEV